MRQASPPSRWEVAAELTVVKIRWFGLIIGCAVVYAMGYEMHRLLPLASILTLGAVFTLADTYYTLRGQVLLGRSPLFVSAMESLFIGLLCFFDTGLDSPFRYYYFLSIISCAVRHSSGVTFITAGLHSLSMGILFFNLPQTPGFSLVLMLVMLTWLTWSSTALASLLKQTGERLTLVNEQLRNQQAELEQRIAERTAELQEAQAHVHHQEKMAAFGLLAAGIAHEVGNPLTSISSIVQMLQGHCEDEYTLNKLSLVSGQLKRIQGTLRELIEFSRPVNPNRTRVALADILDEALNIAKYYKRPRGRIAMPQLPAELPLLYGVKDQLVQIFLNLILNAIDATEKEAPIELLVQLEKNNVLVSVRDEGCGIPPEQASKLFRPYFTTKKHGTGLGLFVTRRMVRDHGGDVTFISVPGRGTTFTVRLPVPRENHDHGAKTSDPPARIGADPGDRR
jgi:signal transduction histidine kinase